MRFWVRNFMGIIGICALLSVGRAAQTATLNDALAILKAHRFIDLTHSFGPGIPHFSQAPDETVKVLYTVAKDGFEMQEFCHIGQWGTHVDPPAHFHAGLHSVDQIDPTDMVMPLVVIEVRSLLAS